MKNLRIWKHFEALLSTVPFHFRNYIWYETCLIWTMKFNMKYILNEICLMCTKYNMNESTKLLLSRFSCKCPQFSLLLSNSLFPPPVWEWHNYEYYCFDWTVLTYNQGSHSHEEQSDFHSVHDVYLIEHHC